MLGSSAQCAVIRNFFGCYCCCYLSVSYINNKIKLNSVTYGLKQNKVVYLN